jgi:alpha-D-xyloside xylohydrolase
LFVYPGADGEFSLYRDDGKTFDYARGLWSRLNILWNNRGRTLSLRFAPGSRPVGPVRENIVAHVVGETATREINFRGSPIQLKI